MLLDEIISTLSSASGSLYEALLKTKVLLYEIGRKDLVTWINHELNGYPVGSELPDYRRLDAMPHAHTMNGWTQHTNYPLPVMQLKEKQREQFTHADLAASIASIEESIRGWKEKGHALRKPLPAEIGYFYRKILTPGTNIISAWADINMLDVEQILAVVRSRLLDFALELRELVGSEAPAEALKTPKVREEAAKLFELKVTGTGHTINIGNDNVQSITYTNAPGDLDGLISTLAEAGIPEPELLELRKAITHDNSAGKNPNIGEGETGSWFGKLMKKALDKTIDVGVDFAAKLAAEAIKNYSGG